MLKFQQINKRFTKNKHARVVYQTKDILSWPDMNIFFKYLKIAIYTVYEVIFTKRA